MATTKIWPVRGRIEKVIRYAENPDKTENPAAVQWNESDAQSMTDVMVEAVEQAKQTGLFNVLEYAMADHKTEKRYFVSALNCNTAIARDEMLMTKKRYRKEGGIVAFHAYQSFSPDEVDAETAHQIGIELAEKLWGDRFEVVIATHLNSKCMHNHFVINSVSFMDGYRYYDQKKTYRRMREVSDELCRKYRLSVIEHPGYKGKHYAEYDAERKGKRTWRSVVKEDIDNAVMQSLTWKGFTKALERKGYVLKYSESRTYFSVLPPGASKFVRCDKMGNDYSQEGITRRIMRQTMQTHPPTPEPPTVIRVKVRGDFHLSKVTWKGLRALYFFYLHKLRQAAKQPKGYAPYALRADLWLMNAISEQARFLHKYQIDTAEQLDERKAGITHQISSLISERDTLKNEKRRVDITPERTAEINARIAEISKLLKPLRKEVRLCDAVIERSLIIREKNEQLREQARTEKQKEQNRSKSTHQKTRNR